MIDLKSVKLGSDAEVILCDATGRPFPGCGIFGGTKKVPRRLSDDGIAVQEDNVLLEFNIPVSSTEEQWCRNIERTLNHVRPLIPPTLYIHTEATAEYDRALLDNNQANTFGCDPDYCAWDGTRNPRPRAKNPNLRSAAAHVHISWDNPTDEERFKLIQAADIFVVLPSISESSDRKRRELYGRAGAFRPKEYGVEHRVLDNYWIFEDVWRGAVFKRYIKAIEFVNSGAGITTEDATAIQRAINEYDLDLAESLITKFVPKKTKSKRQLSSSLEAFINEYAAP